MLKILIGSFSYKKGYPQDDTVHGGGFVFDCRSVTNPGRYDQYKDLTGKDESVKQFLNSSDDANLFFEQVKILTETAVKKYLAKDFDYLSVQFGCTGGQHRSVFFAEKLAKHLSTLQNCEVELTHRDCPK